MKKIILLLTFMFCAFFSFAQNDSCSYNNVYVNDIFYKARNKRDVIYNITGIFFDVKKFIVEYTMIDL